MRTPQNLAPRVRHQRRVTRLALAAALAVLAVHAASAQPTSTPSTTTAAPKPASTTPAQAGAALITRTRAAWSRLTDDASAGKPTKPAADQLTALAKWAAINIPATQHDALSEVVAHARLASSLSAETNLNTQRVIAADLAATPLPVRIELGLLFGPDDQLASAAQLARTLSAQAGLTDAPPDRKSPSTAPNTPSTAAPTTAPFDGFIAAMALVHDTPFTLDLNGTSVDRDTPQNLLKFYIDNRARMSADPATLAPALAVYVVDSSATVAELTWALNRYAGQDNIEPRYKDVPYDDTALSTGRDVRALKDGFSLQACLRGGVCVHQAYFASTVAKALGIPSAYTVAPGRNIGHAWVGFLRLQGSGGPQGWDFDTGRFGEFDRTRGLVRDPQSGRTISDGRVHMTGPLAKLNPAQRRAAEALALLALAQTDADDATIEGLTPPTTGKPRPTGQAGRLALLDEALDRSPQSVPAWLVLASISDTLEAKARVEWNTRLLRAAPDDAADFAFDVTGLMIAHLPTPPEQADAWATFGASLRAKRRDLAAEATIRQARALEEADRPDAAWGIYQKVVSRSLNEGTAAVAALTDLERMLKARGKPELIPDQWGDALKRARRPTGGAPEYRMGSTWAKIAFNYQRTLREAGRTDEAEKLAGTIDSVLGRR